VSTYNDVLIIDDDKDDCIAVERSLFQIGVKASLAFAYDGNSAFELLNNSERLPRLIILDVNLPGIDGFDILRRLKLKYQIPVILHTTVCNEDIMERALNLGAIDCVQKGTSFADNLKFAMRISEVLRTF
jgi:DNA-binding response OmpR family regulator